MATKYGQRWYTFKAEESYGSLQNFGGEMGDIGKDLGAGKAV